MLDALSKSHIISIYGNDLIVLRHWAKVNDKELYFKNNVYQEWKSIDELVNRPEQELNAIGFINNILSYYQPNKIFVITNRELSQLYDIDIWALARCNNYVIFYNPSIPLPFPSYYLNELGLEFKAAALIRELNARLRSPNDNIYEIVKRYPDLTCEELISCLNIDNTIDEALVERLRKSKFNTEILQFIRTDVTMDMVADFDDLKQWLEEYDYLRKSVKKTLLPKGIIIEGNTGTGKTFVTKAMASTYWNNELIMFNSAAIYEKFVGSSEDNIRSALSLLDSLDDGLLLIDEIDKMLTWGSENVDAGVSKRVIGLILTWLSERKPGIFIVGTTNKFNSIPPEMIRRGRFDKVFHSPDYIEPEDMIAKIEKKYGIVINDNIRSKLNYLSRQPGAVLEGIILDLYRSEHVLQRNSSSNCINNNNNKSNSHSG